MPATAALQPYTLPQTPYKQCIRDRCGDNALLGLTLSQAWPAPCMLVSNDYSLR